MATKNVNKTRLLMKHDIEANWLKAENFIPLEGEIVVYDADETHSRPRMKIGDGKTQVGALSFVSPETIEPHMQLVTNADGETVWEERTHYFEEVAILPETSFTETDVTGEGVLISTLFSLEEGKEYIVLYNGTRYASIATMLEPNLDPDGDGIADYDGLCLGNPSPFGGEDNGLPFTLIGTSNGYPLATDPNSGLNLYASFVPLDGATSGSFSLIGKQAKKLDSQFYDAANWSSNKGEPGYVVNRTHYVGTYKEYIPEVSLTVVIDEAFTGFPYPYAALELPNFNSAEYDVNEVYTITYNGVNYDCKFTYINGYDLCAGNLSALNGPSNNEPFAIAIMNTMNPITLMVLAIDQADNATITLKISNDTARVKKLDKKFLPDISLTSNWNAVKGEEGYIENRTHYYAPGFTANWDGITEGKIPTAISAVGLEMIGYKISDNFSTIDLQSFFDEKKGKIVFSSSGESQRIIPLIGNEDGDFIFLFDMDSDNSDGILSASNSIVTVMMGGNSGIMSVPSPGLYYVKTSVDMETREAFNVIIEDAFKTLDPAYISSATLNIISQDYKALIKGEERVEDPNNNHYDFNLNSGELTTLLTKNLLHVGNLYYTISTDSTEVRVLPIEYIYMYDYDMNNLLANSPFHIYCHTAVDKQTKKFAKITINVAGDSSSSLGLQSFSWQEENEITIDTTLTKKGQAADAKASGDAIEELKNTIVPNYRNINGYTLDSNITLNAADVGAATEEYVDTAVANLVDSSPDTLNTLNELAAALGDDPNFATTVINQIAEKVDKTTTINGKALNNNITLNASDVKALPNTISIKSGTSPNSIIACSADDESSTYTIGQSAFAEGHRTQATALASHAEGFLTKATGDDSHSEGIKSVASGNHSHAEGSGSIASGQISHAEGADTVASGSTSHSEGNKTLSSGSYSHAEGNQSVARGESAHAEGKKSKALGNNSHSEGRSVAIGVSAHSEGDYGGREMYLTGTANATTYTYSNATFGVSVGFFISLGDKVATITELSDTTITVSETLSSEELTNEYVVCFPGAAKGDYSHVEGEGTYAGSARQHVQGAYNIPDDEDRYAHIIGGGVFAQRKNIHTLDWSGNAWYQGDVYVGGSGQDDAAAEKLVKQSELDAAVTNLPVLDNIVLKDSVTGVHYTLYIANGEIMIKNEVVE